MTLKSGDYPWIIFDANPDDKKKQMFVCTRCGQNHKLSTLDGVSINYFLKLSEAFCELHKDCKEVDKGIVRGDRLNQDVVP